MSKVKNIKPKVIEVTLPSCRTQRKTPIAPSPSLLPSPTRRRRFSSKRSPRSQPSRSPQRRMILPLLRKSPPNSKRLKLLPPKRLPLPKSLSSKSPLMRKVKKKLSPPLRLSPKSNLQCRSQWLQRRNQSLNHLNNLLRKRLLSPSLREKLSRKWLLLFRRQFLLLLRLPRSLFNRNPQRKARKK